jgi:hypothetical protein
VNARVARQQVVPPRGAGLLRADADEVGRGDVPPVGHAGRPAKLVAKPRVAEATRPTKAGEELTHSLARLACRVSTASFAVALGVPMIHVATVHHLSPRWIDLQLRYLAQNVSEPYQTWASLQGIDPRYHEHFDVVVPSAGRHAGKLNLLATRIADAASDDDLIVFIDGDAFPIADPLPTVRAALADTALVAIRRDENLGDPQPHPSFCATTVKQWTAIGGDWSNGYAWRNSAGEEVSDVGGNLLYKLEQASVPWTPLLRTNRRNVHPLWFGIYGNVVYHHGAGFRGTTSRFDRAGGGGRLRRYARQWSKHRLSKRVFKQIETDPDFYREFL